MNANPTAAVLGLLAIMSCTAFSQAVPATPTKFNTKPVGSATGTTGASINPPAANSVVRHVTYLALSPLRQWNSTDGKSLFGTLIAWEESVITTPGGTSAPTLQTAPIAAKPTVLKNNKARFLIDHKVFEVPLNRLAVEERTFVEDLQKAVNLKP